MIQNFFTFLGILTFTTATTIAVAIIRLVLHHGIIVAAKKIMAAILLEIASALLVATILKPSVFKVVLARFVIFSIYLYHRIGNLNDHGSGHIGKVEALIEHGLKATAQMALDTLIEEKALTKRMRKWAERMGLQIQEVPPPPVSP